MSEGGYVPEKQQASPEGAASKKESPSSCACVSDPFACLPNEMRPRPQPKKGELRKVHCPECGQEYWTNRDTDVCIPCGNSGSKG